MSNSKNYKRNKEAALRRENRQRMVAVFTALAICLTITWAVIEFRSVLFRDLDPEPTAPQLGTTNAVPPISVITAPPETSTNPPVTTTNPPVTTTDPPVTGTNPPETSTNPPETSTNLPETSTNPPVTTTNPPVTTTDPPVTGTNPPETSTNPPETTEPPAPPVQLVTVPEGERVDDNYFADAPFIGDSRTVGLNYWSGLKTNYYCEQGLNVSTVQTKGYIGAEKLTLAEAFKKDGSFTKVYLAFGINEIGWPSTDNFIKAYRSLIQIVKDGLPNASICVQSILPMSKTTAESARYSDMGGNAKVAEYNERLRELAEEMGVYYANVVEIFSDENGDLIAEDSTDGIHLGVASTKKWAEYLRTHPLP